MPLSSKMMQLALVLAMRPIACSISLNFALRTPSRDQCIIKLDYDTLRLGIYADCLNKLLVYRRTLNDVNGSAIAHHRENIHGVIVVHYGNDGELVTITLLPVD